MRPCPRRTPDVTDFAHAPVLMREMLALAHGLQPAPARLVDCTVGGAGHAQALLEAFPEAQFLGIDRDPNAVRVASARLARFGPRAQVVHATFSQVGALVAQYMPLGASLLLSDFGVSSHQLDVAERGFSFRFDGPLDMRMDPTQGQSAQELCATADLDTLTQILRNLGEERYARRIAQRIVATPPSTTGALRALVHDCVPKSFERIDPATRTFQGLRMAVNDELGQIDALLCSLPAVLAPGGLFVAMSFHSLEDRAVKQALKAMSVTCTCPRLLPTCCCGHVAALRLRPGKALRPQDDEITRNPRSRSTRLRAAYRLPEPTA